MGNSPSNRRVTVVNDDVVGVVQVSESVVRRLKGLPDKSSEPVEEPTAQKPEQAPESGIHVVPNFSPFVPGEQYSSTLEQRQKYHEEFRKAERSWNNRINELEAQNRQLFEATKEKFSDTLSEIEDNHMKNSYAPVCPDKEQKVLNCYKENAKFPLRCSREVDDFMECVDKLRMTALSK